VRYGFEFRRPESGEVVARGEVVAVHSGVDAASGALKALSIPEPLRSVLAEKCGA